MGAPQYEQAGADISGTGTPNTIPRWTGPSTLGDSGLIDDGTQVYTTTRKLAVGSASAVSELTAVTGAVAPTANPPALQTLHGNNQNVFRAKYTSANFNVSGNWLGLGLGYHDNYMKAAIIAEAKDGTGRASMHIALNAATTAANVGLADARLTVTYDGNVGIGTASPVGRTDIAGTSVDQLAWGLLSVRSSDAQGADKGGSLAFGGLYDATNSTHWAQISGRKENGTSGQYGGYLAFATRTNGAGANTERARIDSAGSVCINTTNARTSRFSVEQTGTGTKLATFSNAVDADFEIKSASAGLLTIGTGTGTLAIQSGGTERMRVSNSGVASASQVAIGTSSFTTGRALTTVADLDVFGLLIGRGPGASTTNTVVGGSSALAANTSGINNTAFGASALSNNTSGSTNTGVGLQALLNNTSGSSNVAVGPFALGNTNGGSSNIALGREATTAAAGDSNQLVLGSATYYVATNGGATTYYATAGALLGYMQIRLNGANVKIPVYAP